MEMVKATSIVNQQVIDYLNGDKQGVYEWLHSDATVGQSMLFARSVGDDIFKIINKVIKDES